MVAAIGQTIFLEPSLGSSLVTALATPGRIGFWEFSNSGDEDVWVQLFDLPETEIEIGETRPTLSLLVPAKGGNDKVFAEKRMPKFTRAIRMAATTAPIGANGPAVGIVANLILHDT